MQPDTHQILLRGEETGGYPKGNADNRIIRCLEDKEEQVYEHLAQISERNLQEKVELIKGLQIWKKNYYQLDII